MINELLSSIDELLKNCDCNAACSKCLKHYRNQYVHGMLDRFEARELLHWGLYGTIADPITLKDQIRMTEPLIDILEQSGCKISVEDKTITGKSWRCKKSITVYPAMWVEPHQKNVIFVSDAYIKYAKPYAVQKILDDMENG